MNVVAAGVTNAKRLNVLHKMALLDTPSEQVFDQLTQLASDMIGAPVSLVSLVDQDRQFFKSSVGLPEPWRSMRETPLTHSFCQHIVASGQPLIIEDARETALVKDNLAIPDLNVIGYLGMPLETSTGDILGSFCVIDGKPRVWSEREIAIVRNLSMLCMSVIETRAQLMDLHQFAEDRLNNALDQIGERDAEIARLKTQIPT